MGLCILETVRVLTIVCVYRKDHGLKFVAFTWTCPVWYISKSDLGVKNRDLFQLLVVLVPGIEIREHSAQVLDLSGKGCLIRVKFTQDRTTFDFGADDLVKYSPHVIIICVI